MLFDSYYLNKGPTLYRLLGRVTDDFKLYIYSFDDKAHDVLEDMKFEHAVILRREDLEARSPVLERLKQERSKAEYSWTCTPVRIKYI